MYLWIHQGVILDRFVELGVAGLEGIDAPRCLDIASGPGEPALSIAAALPHATVTATDLAEGMVQIARERAQEQGLSNVKCANFHAITVPSCPEIRLGHELCQHTCRLNACCRCASIVSIGLEHCEVGLHITLQVGACLAAFKVREFLYVQHAAA